MNYSARRFHILVFSRCVVALLFSTACVSTPQYEQVSSAVEVERETHRRTYLALENTQKQLSDLEARLAQTEGSFTKEAGQRAELDLKQTRTERELASAEELANELRGEVGRLRDNLEASLAQLAELKLEKERLEKELDKSEKCDATPAEDTRGAPRAAPADPDVERGEEAAADESSKSDDDRAEAPGPLPDRGA
jgi:chromosome segregation ATPase